MRSVVDPVSSAPNVAGVDPGRMCGVAFYGPRGFKSFQLTHDRAGTFITDRVRERLTLYGPIIIGCQRFTMGHGARTHQPQALQLIGELEHLARAQSGVTLQLQGAADAHHAGSPDLLRRLGWWAPSMEHANDAAAHVALTLLQHYPVMWYDLTHTVD
jgi:hypothetical protein